MIFAWDRLYSIIFKTLQNGFSCIPSLIKTFEIFNLASANTEMPQYCHNF